MTAMPSGSLSPVSWSPYGITLAVGGDPFTPSQVVEMKCKEPLNCYLGYGQAALYVQMSEIALSCPRTKARNCLTGSAVLAGMTQKS